MKIHRLKTWPQPFMAITLGVKRFEIRKNDRDFKIGDVLNLHEWDPNTGKYTGKKCSHYVTYILYGPVFGIEDGYCIMGI